MGRDFRIGLVAGLVLAGAALLWVATRPSLRPQAAEARNPHIPPTGASDDSFQSQNRGTDEPTAGAGLVGAGFKPARTVVVPAPAPEATEPQPTVPVVADKTTQASRPAPFPAPLDASGMRDLTVYESAEPIKTIRFHIVRRGETLSHIAQQYYGSKEQWRRIVAANTKTIKDADKITPGTKLILPE